MGVNTKPYLDHNSDLSAPGSKHAIFLGPQTVKGTYVEPVGATGAVLLTSRTTPNQPQEQHEDESFRAGSRSQRETIAGRFGPIEFEVESYFKPPVAMAVSSAVTVNPPQGDDLLENAFGSVDVVNAQNSVAVASIVAHSKTETVITVADSSLYAVGDPVRYIKGGAVGTDDGIDGTVRFVTALNVGGANRLTFNPGFHGRPTTSGFIQGCRQYPLTNARHSFLSARTVVGDVGQEIKDIMVNGITIEPSGNEPLKITAACMGLSHLVSGDDQIRGESGNDSFLSTDTLLDVGDGLKFDDGATVDLKLIAVATDLQVGSTETSATVVSTVTTTDPHTITLLRGSSPVAATQLNAITSTTETSETYNTVTKNVLRLSLDGQPSIDIALTAGGTETAATMVADINAALLASRYYGENTQAYLDIDWGTVASVATATDVRLTSPIFGSQSSIVVSDTGLASSAHDEIFTGAFTETAVDEVQIVPHELTATELGTTLHGWEGIFWHGGYCLGVDTWSISFLNNDRVLNEVMKATQNPTDIVGGKTRTLEITMSGPASSAAARYFKIRKNNTTENGVFQVGGIDGSAGIAVGLNVFTIVDFELDGDDELSTMTITLRAVASSSNEDEIWLAVFGAKP